MRIAVVYYSQTGNTEAMAEVIERTLEGKAEVVEIDPSLFSSGDLAGYDAFAFGCPAMGDEVLEEEVFEPMFSAIESGLAGKRIILFGSYGWGDGQWMRDWVERTQSTGANLLDEEGLMVNETPDAEALEVCKNLGARLANA